MSLFNRSDDEYRRLVFTVYWMNCSPSSEIFYLRNHRGRITPAAIASLEGEALHLLRTMYGWTRAIQAICIGDSGIEMSADDLAAAAWRVLA